MKAAEFDINYSESEIETVRRRRDKGKIDAKQADAEIDALYRKIASAKVELERAEQALARFNRQLLRDGYMKMAMPEG